MAAQPIKRFRPLRRRRHVGWAVVATVVAFALPALISGEAGLTATTAYLLAVLFLVVGVIAVRQLLAVHWSARPVHRAWPPGLLIECCRGAAGVPWAAGPYVRVPRRTTRIHLAGPVRPGYGWCHPLASDSVAPRPPHPGHRHRRHHYDNLDAATMRPPDSAGSGKGWKPSRTGRHCLRSPGPPRPCLSQTCPAPIESASDGATVGRSGRPVTRG